METPWKVFGFEHYVDERGEACTRLFVARPFICPQGSTGEGTETRRLYYKDRYLKLPYQPTIGHKIIAVEGRYGIDQIFVVGVDNGQ